MSNIVSQRFIKCHNHLKEHGTVRSSRQFALSLDYLPQSLSEILKERRDVTIELLRRAIEKYNINPVYIFTGEGPMFMTESHQQGLRVLTIVTDAQNDTRIVHVPTPAQAGYASEEHTQQFIQNLPTFSLPDYKYQVGTHRSFDVSGDSMEPTLFEGDKVVCSFIDPTLWEKSIKDNYVYVIVARGDILVRRVHNRLADSGALELISDNNYYDTTTIKPGEIKEIWYVRAKISPFLPSPTGVKNFVREEVRDLRGMLNQQSKLLESLGKEMKGAFRRGGEENSTDG